MGRLLYALAREIGDDDLPGMAAEMAYHFLFAIFPLLLLLATVLGFVGQAVGLSDLLQRLLQQVGVFLPSEFGRTIEGLVASLLRSHSSGFLTVGILGTVWGAASGVSTLIKGLNRAYDVEESRPYWKRQLLALLTTVLLPPAAIGLLVLAIVGRSLIDWLGVLFGLGDRLTAVVAVARWPALTILMSLVLSLLYYVLPHTRQRYRWCWPGTAFATLAWLVLTGAFGVYVANFGHFQTAYGSFGAAMLSLLWLYLVGLVVLVGGELNALFQPAQRSRWLVERGVDASRQL